jgi:hypothetical protein
MSLPEHFDGIFVERVLSFPCDLLALLFNVGSSLLIRIMG